MVKASPGRRCGLFRQAHGLPCRILGVDTVGDAVRQPVFFLIALKECLSSSPGQLAQEFLEDAGVPGP